MTTTPAELISEARSFMPDLTDAAIALAGALPDDDPSELENPLAHAAFEAALRLRGAEAMIDRLAAALEAAQAGASGPQKAWEAGYRTGLANRAIDFRPGVFRCPKCGLRSVTINMDVTTGNTEGAQTADCPNECGPAWPVTWKDDCLSAECELDAASEKLAAQPQGSGEYVLVRRSVLEPLATAAELIEEAEEWPAYLRGKTQGNAPSTKMPSDVIELLAGCLRAMISASTPTDGGK